MRLPSHECRKKRMMNIDDSMRREMTKEIGRKYLHVAGEHDQIDAKHFEQINLLLLGLRFVLLCHRNHRERHLIKVGPLNDVRMVADDHGDFAGEFTEPLAIEKVGEAMVVARNED